MSHRLRLAVGFSAMRYDGAGNLTRYRVESPAGKHSQEYELGDYNQVLRIRNGGDNPAPDVTFRYDQAGRAFAMQAGRRSSTASYDALDRAVRLTLDGKTIVDYAYGPLDEDTVAASDGRTGETLAPFGLSPAPVPQSSSRRFGSATAAPMPTG